MHASVFDPQKTVLITGGTGALGALVAKHVVHTLGVGSVLLASRSGLGAPGAVELQAELAEQGARVAIVECDLADRGQVEELLTATPPQFPLGAVVHAAGVLDDAVLDSLTIERLDRVLSPKLDGAWYLHELTEHLDLSAFVLFSSAAGIFGEPAKANYGAANAFLDGLAAYRRSRGLAGVSVAWGLWGTDHGARSDLSSADMARIARSGVGALASEEGLDLFDAACGAQDASLIAVRLDMAALSALARAEVMPALLRGLVRVPSRRSLDSARRKLSHRLMSVSEVERQDVVLEVLCAEVAAVLGHAPSEAVPQQRSFIELGFTSLAALELRNRLNAVTGLRLPATIVFDYPTPIELARYLCMQPALVRQSGAGLARAGLDSLEDRGGQTSAADRSSDTIASLFQQARGRGLLEESVELLMVASKLRPTFATKLDRARAPAPVVLSEGPAAPRLICLPSLVAMAGPHQYVRFARTLRDVRKAAALPTPGYVRGEDLPATVDLAAETQAETVRGWAEDAPFAIVGYSSGGILAHAVASHLTTLGLAPAALVLIDPYPIEPQAITDHLAEFIDQVFAREGAEAFVTDAWLTAMAAYIRLFAGWQPADVPTPTLFVRPASPAPGMSGEDWRSTWESTQEVLEVPGDHFTMMENHADTTAQAIESWLVSIGRERIAVD